MTKSPHQPILLEILCCARSSSYDAIPWVATRKRTSSAWLTTSPLPVIAHPPCRFWSRSSNLSRATGLDMIRELLLGLWCVRQVARRGGIVEQPAWSRLWRAANLPRPTSQTQSPYSWSISLDQYTFGHRVHKPTWLWFCHIHPGQLPRPPLALRPDPQRTQGDITAGQRSATPPLFARWLCDCALHAEHCGGWRLDIGRTHKLSHPATKTMDDLKQDTTDTKHVPAEALRAAGLAEAPSFADWPKTPDGRLLCSPEHPMPIHIGDAHTYRWAHTNFHKVRPQRDGWPAGDIVTKKCDDCGIVVEAELPQ